VPTARRYDFPRYFARVGRKLANYQVFSSVNSRKKNQESGQPRQLVNPYRGLEEVSRDDRNEAPVRTYHTSETGRSTPCLTTPPVASTDTVAIGALRVPRSSLGSALSRVRLVRDAPAGMRADPALIQVDPHR
jgi:hypothetical protein